ncbi:MAG: ABC transporter substrate-binding protein [Pigmentiphaga sp.]
MISRIRHHNLLVSISVAGVLAASAAPAQAEITIGAIYSVTGPAAALGIGPRNAMALWPKEIGGEPVRILVYDDASDPSQATRHARKLTEEDKVDLIIGSTVTPGALAISEVAIETGTPQLAASPVELAANKEGWTFRLPQSVALMAEGTIEHMRQQGVKTFGFLGYSDAYGESWLQELKKNAEREGIRLTAAERFGRADTSVTAQTLRLLSTKPEAVVIVASGSGSAMPQLTVKERGYDGLIYQTFGAVAPDLIRLAGKAAEGTYGLSGPAVAPDQLPADHPSRQAALDYVAEYEQANGKGSYNQFAANIQGGLLVLQEAIPLALQQARPGTPEFRTALRDALRSVGEVAVPQGVLNYTADDPYGFDERGRFVLQVQDGVWRAVR